MPSSHDSHDFSTSQSGRTKDYAEHVEDASGHDGSSTSASTEHYTRYPNRWSRIRYAGSLNACPLCSHGAFSELIREPAAEFFGVMVLIIFGNGVDCQVVLSGNPGVASSPKGVSGRKNLASIPLTSGPRL